MAAVNRSLRLKLSKYIPRIAPTYGPNPKQLAFLLLTDTLEVLYGGAAGPGKSWALLAEATRFVDDYPVKSLLIRRTYKDLAQPGGLMAKAHEWFSGTDAHWTGDTRTWTFPTGAQITFGYMENENDHLQYQGGEYHMVGFDELTQLRELQYLYLYSRVRRVKGFPVPPRVRAATNPGGPGHEWVRKRWNLPNGPHAADIPKRKFIEAHLEDNPHLSEEEYGEQLAILASSDAGDVTYRQLRHGDWTAMGTGGFYDPAAFEVVGWDSVPSAHLFRNIIRYWDFGATEQTELNPSPDYTVGLKIGVTHTGQATVDNPRGAPDYYVFDVLRARRDPAGVNLMLREGASRDGIGVAQWLEQERGAAGKLFVANVRENLLTGNMVRGLWVTGDKITRGKMAAAVSKEGRIKLVEGAWNQDFKAEAGAFPEGDHDDQMDALSYGIIALDREHNMAASGQAANRGKDMAPVRRAGQKSIESKLVHIGY
jgi:predicted phage terminase large subunit-like protein